MKVYISGNVSENPHFEEDFNKIKKELSFLKGVEPINPLKLNKTLSLKDWVSLIGHDIEVIANSDAIIMLNGRFPVHRTTKWNKSPDANIELWAAKKFNLKIFYGYNQFLAWYQKESKYGIENSAYLRGANEAE